MRKNKVRFVAKHAEMLDLNYTLPQPAENFMPDWFNKVPPFVVEQSTTLLRRGTTKSCPSFSDTFKEGFIIPAPCDIWLKVDENGNWAWQTGNSHVECEIHSNDIMVDYLPKSSNVRQVFKLMLPFTIHTSKNIWIRQVPMFWNYNTDFHISYEQFNTNKIHQVNLQIHYTSDKDEIIIKQGTPLGQYVPFRKEKFDIKVVKQNNKYKSAEAKYIYSATSKFKGGYYHNLRD